VVSPGVVLPDRCVKCDAAAEGRRLVVTLRRTPAVPNLLSLVLFLIVPILWLRADEAEVEVGICRRHLARRRWTSALIACAVLASLGMIAVGAMLGAEYGYLLLAGLVLLPAAPIAIGLAGRFLTAARIEPRLVWIKGACPEYLARVPERNAGEHPPVR
jgi:hypothetical protein